MVKKHLVTILQEKFSKIIDNIGKNKSWLLEISKPLWEHTQEDNIFKSQLQISALKNMRKTMLSALRSVLHNINRWMVWWHTLVSLPTRPIRKICSSYLTKVVAVYDFWFCWCITANWYMKDDDASVRCDY